MSKKYSDRKHHLLEAQKEAKNALWRINELFKLLQEEENQLPPDHNGPASINYHMTPYTVSGGVSECPRCIWDSQSESRRKERLNLK